MSVLHDLLNAQPPEQVFHYTSVGALLGIAQSKCMWASNIHYLNDEQDFAYGLDITRMEILRRREQADLVDEQRRFLEGLEQRITSMSGVHVFVASFSEVDDVLSQWRGYCAPGKGVAVGFWSSELRQRASEQGFKLIPAVYDGRVQAQLARELVADVIRLHGETPANAEHLMGRFAYTLAQLAPLVKHEKFQEEREWRLVSDVTPITHPQIRVRDGRVRLIPYFEFRLAALNEQLRLAHLRIGPSPDVMLSVNGISAAMTVHNVKYVGIGRSFVPYRDW